VDDGDEAESFQMLITYVYDGVGNAAGFFGGLLL